jgi:hypothetical protein
VIFPGPCRMLLHVAIGLAVWAGTFIPYVGALVPPVTQLALTHRLFGLRLALPLVVLTVRLRGRGPEGTGQPVAIGHDRCACVDLTPRGGWVVGGGWTLPIGVPKSKPSLLSPRLALFGPCPVQLVVPAPFPSIIRYLVGLCVAARAVVRELLEPASSRELPVRLSLKGLQPLVFGAVAAVRTYAVILAGAPPGCVCACGDKQERLLPYFFPTS